MTPGMNRNEEQPHEEQQAGRRDDSADLITAAIVGRLLEGAAFAVDLRRACAEYVAGEISVYPTGVRPS